MRPSSSASANSATTAAPSASFATQVAGSKVPLFDEGLGDARCVASVFAKFARSKIVAVVIQCSPSSQPATVGGLKSD